MNQASLKKTLTWQLGKRSAAVEINGSSAQSHGWHKKGHTKIHCPDTGASTNVKCMLWILERRKMQPSICEIQDVILKIY